MMNENVLHLASLVRVGTEVTIVRSLSGRVAAAAKKPESRPRTAEKDLPQSPRIINRDADRAADDDDDNYDPYNGWH